VVFPAATSVYNVSAGKDTCRHITVGRNATVQGNRGNSINSLAIWGNCWVKDGGRAYFVTFVGPQHTFFRRDGRPELNAKGRMPVEEYNFGDKTTIVKHEGASVELLGLLGLSDECYIAGGKTILGPGCEFLYSTMTGNGTFEVYDGGVLELQDGAALSISQATSENNVAVHKGGVLQAGSPERPIKSDVYIRLASSNKRGFCCFEGGKVRVYSADPAKARLVFESNEPGVAVTGGIHVVVLGDVELRGAHFDQIAPGGIHIADGKMPGSWQHISFGPNVAEADGSHFSGLDGYVKRRKDEKYRLYVMPSLKRLQEFTENDE
jgi:hypothetical protein